MKTHLSLAAITLVAAIGFTAIGTGNAAPETYTEAQLDAKQAECRKEYDDNYPPTLQSRAYQTCISGLMYMVRQNWIAQGLLCGRHHACR